MTTILSTGRVARLLGTTEPKAAETVRRGLIDPAPEVLLGRRHWYREHVLQAAEALGVLTPELHERIEHETVAMGGDSRG